ncbi:hypothetical protein PRIPAC_84268, partial [Pristionchus pacificus]
AKGSRRKMLPFFVLLCVIVLSNAKVLFQTSAIYDEYDMNGNKDIALESCIIGGCSIYVSVPQWNMEMTKNLFFYSKTANTNQSLYSIATEVDPITWAKTSYHTADTVNSIMNYNTKDIGPIVIYVVGSHAPKYSEISGQVEIYDASNINMRPAKNKQMTMILSAEPYNIFVQAYGANLNAYVRATGFDNNWQRKSQDDCRIIYDHNQVWPFRLRINSPVITINFDGQSNYGICANIDQSNGALLDYPGITTSQGYVGCKVNSNAPYRSSYYSSSVFELKDAHNADRDTDITYDTFTRMTDKVTLTTYFGSEGKGGGSKRIEIGGNSGDNGKEDTDFITEKAYKMSVIVDKQYGSSYWIGYKPSATSPTSNPSGEGICTDWSKTSTGISQTPPTTTTSGANELFTVLSSAIALFVARNF